MKQVYKLSYNQISRYWEETLKYRSIKVKAFVPLPTINAIYNNIMFIPLNRT